MRKFVTREEKKHKMSHRFTVVENGEKRVEEIEDMHNAYGNRVNTVRFCEERENSVDLDNHEPALSSGVLNWETICSYMLSLSQITTLSFDIAVDSTNWCTMCCRALDRHQKLTSVTFGQ